MTFRVIDAVVDVDAAQIVSHFDLLAPADRDTLAKAVSSQGRFDVVFYESDGEAFVALVPVSKSMARLTPAGQARLGMTYPNATRFGSKREAAQYAANARWNRRPLTPEEEKALPKGVKQVEIGPSMYDFDYTEAFAASHPDPAKTPERLAAMADPEFHGGMTPLDPNGKDTYDQFVKRDAAGEVILNEHEEPVFSEERTRLHDAIIERFLTQRVTEIGPDGFPVERQILDSNGRPVQIPRSNNPTVFMMGGGPASGKSTAVKAGAVKIPSELECVHVDADALKGELPEYLAQARTGDSSLAQFNHEESSHLSKRLVREAQERGMDVFLDGTGDSSIKSLTKKVTQMRERGPYKIVATYLTVPTDLAVQFAAKRGENPLPIPGAKIGRVVPESIVRDTHANVSRTLKAALESDLFDSVELYDTRELGRARKVISKQKGYQAVYSDEALWDQFMNKQYASVITSPTGARREIVQPMNEAMNRVRRVPGDVLVQQS